MTLIITDVTFQHRVADNDYDYEGALLIARHDASRRDKRRSDSGLAFLSFVYRGHVRAEGWILQLYSRSTPLCRAGRSVGLVT